MTHTANKECQSAIEPFLIPQRTFNWTILKTILGNEMSGIFKVTVLRRSLKLMKNFVKSN